MISFFQPVWLLLLVPLAAVWLAWPLPNRFLQFLRALLFMLVVLALAQLAIRLPDRSGAVIVVADRSASMPATSDASQKEIIGLLTKSMGPRDQLGVVSFGRAAVVEQSPQHGEFPGFNAEVGSDHSDLNDAIQLAMSLIGPDGSGRILVLSDGRWTGEDPTSAAASAATRGIALDYRLITRPQASDLAIRNFQTPQSVLPGEGFMLTGWVQSPVDQKIQYELRRDDEIISSGSKQVPAGLSRLMFRDRATASGASEYTLTVVGQMDDPIPENNTARSLVSVDGAKPVLVVSSAGEDSGLVKLLRAGRVDVVGKLPTQCQWSLESLSHYSSVLIENVPAGEIGMSGMQTLADWVDTAGGGLAITGGQKSYGPGGYFKSPLERLLPISMEMRSEHRKISVAVVVALDRSGSMAMPAGGGREKIDLADLGTVQVLDLLSPMDEIGVFAVDTVAHEIVPLDTVEHNRGYRSKILSIDSEGGGIYIKEALVASARMISTAKSQTKHIILFSDASDAELPLDSVDFVAKLRKAGITVSAMGLGTDHDCDAHVLKDIAHSGGGECYFSDNPDELPRIFAQDTFTIARSTFVDQPTPFSMTAGYSLLGSPPPAAPPSLGGYNLCYIRPQANLAAITHDDYRAPVVASWNAGNGRVLCFMGEADGKYSGNLARWKQAGEFYATLARWVAGKTQPLPDEMALTQDVHDGICFVQLHLDPARSGEPFINLPRVRTLQGLPGAPPSKGSATLQWKDADLLQASIPIGGDKTVLNTVEIPGLQPVTLPPVCLPYSPEFAPEQPGRGATALEQLAATTGGKERAEIPQIWNELPVVSRNVALSPWLFVSAAILYLIEILERRTGWISRLLTRRSLAAIAETGDTLSAGATVGSRLVSRFSARIRRPTTASAPSANVPEKAQRIVPAPSAPQSQEGESAMLDALRKARQRATRRAEK
jgi:Mg-chelatase subunit ChlD